jgi:hypothetical protein
MPVCAKCGHEFDIGRFCTNCGHPLDAPVEADAGLDLWRSDTAERLDTAERGGHAAERTDTAGASDTAERPATPGRHAGRAPLIPPPPPPDASARFPLFADQVTTPVRHQADDPERSDLPWLAWVAGAVALLLVAVLGVWLLFGDDESDPDLVAGEPTATPAEKAPQNKPARPGKTPKKTAAPKPGRPVDVTSQATAAVPATAQSSTDFDGNVVGYEARNMLDGVPTTCWRMPGDGSGETITLELPEATRLTSVGLINGYAKTDTDPSGTTLDWYAGNRRIVGVEWAFDDGSVVTQDLTETRALQRKKINPATTSTVELRLLTVTPPGEGPSRRDYTAISDLALVGTPA